MKTLFVALTIIASAGAGLDVKAQFLDKITNAAKRGVENTAQRKVEEKASRATSDAIDGKVAPKSKSGNKNEASGQKSLAKNSIEEAEPKSRQSSKGSKASLEEEDNVDINFKRGSTIIFSDDFSKDATGDFPAKWNSSGGGELKKIKGYDEKYLKVTAGSIINPELTKPLPSNFTVEMDVIFPEASPSIMAGFAFGESLDKIDNLLSSTKGFHTYFESSGDPGRTFHFIHYGLGSQTNYELERINYNFEYNRKVHVAFMINNYSRIRMYVDGKKFIDMPKGFKNSFSKYFYVNGVLNGASYTKDAYFYISNVVIAKSGTDERSLVQKQLLEQGEFTTNDILFATGSDKIQPASKDILSQIGEAMKSAPGMKFEIIGHTDNVGTPANNQVLSEKRATAVKAYLIQNFNINAAILKTSGKGASQPVAENSSESGKAQNRRVVFIKMN